MTSNIKSLTQSHKVIRAKRKQKREQIPAIVFDEDARREFLTGFHKRKLAKKEESKKRALAREKQEHLEARREQRRILAEQATQNAAKVEAAYGGFVEDTGSDDEEWHGIASAPSNDAGLEQETYSDEEQLATVTIVEDFDPSTLIHGPTSSEPQALFPPPPPPPSSSLRKGGERVRDDEGRKTSKRKNAPVRYETKAARRAAQVKQRARRTEKAELAGGKAARKAKAGRKKRR
ncbi:nucleolar protein 12-domain-containing protein [Lactarius sanguifluus]|nr:nucleolar protein 12-domain-containing protein [Lactarius sanguifluus]